MQKISILIIALSLTACSSTIPLAQLDDSAILGDAVKQTKQIAGELVEEATVAIRSDMEAERDRLAAELQQSIQQVRTTALEQAKKTPARIIEKVIEPATVYDSYDDSELRKWISQVAITVQRNRAEADARIAYAEEAQMAITRRLDQPMPDKPVLEEPATQGGLGAFIVLLIAWIAREARARIAKELS